MRVRTVAGLSFLLLTTGCDCVLGLCGDIVECYTFTATSESISADPPDAYPDEPFVLSWVDETDVGDFVTELVEKLSLVPYDGTDPIELPDRTVPWWPSQTSSIDFAEFLALPDFVPANYDFVVDLNPPAADVSGNPVAECPPELGGGIVGKFPLLLTCECNGLYSYGLRIEGATTNPTTFGPGQDAEIVFTIVYDQVACDDSAPVDSGPFQLGITITGPPGQAGPFAFEQASMLSGTSVVVVHALSELVNVVNRDTGTYTVTVSLDPAGSVPECPTLDQTDQVASFSYTVT